MKNFRIFSTNKILLLFLISQGTSIPLSDHFLSTSSPLPVHLTRKSYEVFHNSILQKNWYRKIYGHMRTYIRKKVISKDSFRLYTRDLKKFINLQKCLGELHFRALCKYVSICIFLKLAIGLMKGIYLVILYEQHKSRLEKLPTLEAS